MATGTLDTEIASHDSGNHDNVDPYAITDDCSDDYQKWSDKTKNEKIKAVVITTIKIALVLGCLCLFICSLGLMGSAFQVLAGKTAGDIFSRNEILKNPVTGLMLGVLATVLVQSSSTSTSIFITMTAVDLISVRSGIPLIMGANIGTSVTNTIVSLTQSTNKENFRKAFAGATLLDIFNLLSVIILLPLEIVSHYLERLTGLIMESITEYEGRESPDLLKVITKPLTKKIISVNKTVITKAALGSYLEPESSMVKIWRRRADAEIERYENVPYFIDTGEKVTDNETGLVNDTNVFYKNESVIFKVKVGVQKYETSDFLFANTGMSDGAVGAILLIVSLIAMCICLTGMVKLLTSMLRGNIARIIKKVINTDFPHPFGWITAHIAMLVGAGLTILVQSSSVFTSSITPLVGIGVISIERLYPLTLGSNIGTTTTGILAALASDKFREALQLALCHFFFNISGIIIWYPIPQMRRVPIRAAKALGNKTAKYRWFAPLYICLVFFVIPVLLAGLSIAHKWALWAVLIVVTVIVVPIIVISILQSKKPSALPEGMKTWDFLPPFMRSMKPCDSHCASCAKCCRAEKRPFLKK